MDGPKVGEGLRENSIETEANSSRDTTMPTFEWRTYTTGIDHSSPSVMVSGWAGFSSSVASIRRAGARDKDNGLFEHAPCWNLPSPLKTAMAEPGMPDFVPCKIWQKANAIYAGIFDYPRDRMQSADKVEVGSLFKVVREGWGALSLKERANPVLQILMEVDQNLFWDLDPVTKIANLYKSMLLLKVGLSFQP